MPLIGPPAHDTSAAAAGDEGGEGQKCKLPRPRAKPKAKTQEQTAAAMKKVIASTQNKVRSAIKLVLTAVAALLGAAADELTPLDKIIDENLKNRFAKLQTADASVMPAAELTSVCSQAAADVKIANHRIKVLLPAVANTKRARTT